MIPPRPWEVGDHEARWNGYLLAPGSPVLRNKVGATTTEALRAAENDLLEFRLTELRSQRGLVSRTYDLAHLQRLHLQLFQDVYEWAGDLRTVGIAKGEGEDTSFVPPLDIERPVAHVAARIAESHLLRDVGADELVDEVTYLYDYLNFAHPFREGNGRAQREFFAQLLAESGRGLDWSKADMDGLHSACHAARVDGDTSALRTIIAVALTVDPVY
ncbi:MULTISPECIES: Fic/DOC family protein [unclassified Nocardioides]|uniref:Fic/DOC family protein n=1 Tax=unclassified Nocardioides TaxID=2615069 RepID=UPI0007025E27|nr:MULTISPECIES: Fic family protein [unclassified Nocardioides]KRC57012.1 cell filamentation protein Fic [Nocardioides sp. Root79]KRC77221.1 cell filamentation protein Fic [Nocardioides sp. Root240]